MRRVLYRAQGGDSVGGHAKATFRTSCNDDNPIL